MDKQNIFGFTLDSLSDSLKDFPKFRAKQIYHWLYVHYENDFNQMENLPKNLRESIGKAATSSIIF